MMMDPPITAKPSSGPLYTQAELDLAVAKERERIMNLLTQYWILYNESL